MAIKAGVAILTILDARNMSLSCNLKLSKHEHHR